jgi:hypothetical protein
VEGFANPAVTATLRSMDSVRFGRALGIGARAAAKTLVTAVDAATAPNPAATKTAASPGAAPGAANPAPQAAAGRAENAGAKLGQQAVRTTEQMRQTSRGVKEGSRRFGAAVGGRVVKLSGVLWLELTGVFFGIFALFAAASAWKTRAAVHEMPGNHDAHQQFLISAAMAIVFGYFCASSFMKASRRSRQS